MCRSHHDQMEHGKLKKLYPLLNCALLLTVFLVHVIALQAAPQALSSGIECGSSDFSTLDSQEDIKKIINFLTTDTSEQGITYTGTAGDLSGKKLPLSYYCTPQYWENYASTLPGENNVPVDLYTPGDICFTPADESSAKTQTERVNVHDGCNIYDAATWQIALALAGSNGMQSAHGEDLFSLADNQSMLLKVGYDGNATSTPVEGDNRATSGDSESSTFLYNGHQINSADQAYFFRQVSRNYVSIDPVNFHYVHVQDSSGKAIPPTEWPDNNPYPRICISWCDWKPITGENIWAFLIGPLQAARIQYRGRPIPFDTVGVQNALAMLSTFQKMQSKVGGIYYSPAGSMANSGSALESPYTVSVENNMSALAGLLIFKKVLTDELDSLKNLSANDSAKISEALNVIQTMIYGGTNSFVGSDGTVIAQETSGILKFLKEKAWDSSRNEFLQGGEANKPGQADWVPSSNAAGQIARAVDVNTWGFAVLGQPVIDGTYGFGSSYRLWENVKSWGGYYGPDSRLWGVGYSDLDRNGNGEINPNDHSGIMSGEWTAGAINMVRALISQYRSVANSAKESAEHRTQATNFIASLQQDHDSMVQHIQSLRTDHYSTESAFDAVRPNNYDSLMWPPATPGAASSTPTDKIGYLYASKRYLIPFGWYANPLPSMASTTWAVMLYYNFNPFSINGDYSANPLESGSDDANQ